MIAAYLGVKGTVTTLSTACSSAANAIMLGARPVSYTHLFFPVFREDTPKYKEIERMMVYLKKGRLQEK